MGRAWGGEGKRKGGREISKCPQRKRRASSSNSSLRAAYFSPQLLLSLSLYRLSEDVNEPEGPRREREREREREKERSGRESERGEHWKERGKRGHWLERQRESSELEPSPSERGRIAALFFFSNPLSSPLQLSLPSAASCPLPPEL